MRYVYRFLIAFLLLLSGFVWADDYYAPAALFRQKITNVSIFRNYKIKNAFDQNVSLDFAVIKVEARPLDEGVGVYNAGTVNVEDYLGCAFELDGADYGYYYVLLDDLLTDFDIRGEYVDLSRPVGHYLGNPSTPRIRNVNNTNWPDNVDSHGAKLRALELAMIYQRKVSLGINPLEFSHDDGVNPPITCATSGFGAGGNGDINAERLVKLFEINSVELK